MIIDVQMKKNPWVLHSPINLDIGITAAASDLNLEKTPQFSCIKESRAGVTINSPSAMALVPLFAHFKEVEWSPESGIFLRYPDKYEI